MALGPRDTGSLVMMTGWDATALQGFQLQDGTTFAQVVAEMNTALSTLNGELGNDPLWASLLSFTDIPTVEYRVGSSNGMEEFTEYGRPDAARAATEGHMLPLKSYDRGLGWTWNYLRKAYMSQIRADIADGIKDVRDRWRINILTRLLKRTDDSGAKSGLGSSGYSTGFATTAASTNVDFVPPAFGGTTFANTHEHYVPISGGVFTNAVFSDAYDELREHGHEPPFDFLIGPSDSAVVLALTDTIKVVDPLVQYGTVMTVATVPSPEYIGVNNHFRIREVRGIPQYYGVGYKSYGPNSQRNPLRIRLQKGQTRPLVTAMPDPRSGAGNVYPLQYMVLFTEFGVGVADRTAGTPRYVNNSTWADGTPT
jgi:hypothetical protein